MKSKNKILTISTIFLVMITLLFFSIYLEYSKKYDMKVTEINGVFDISKIHTLDISIKKAKGLNQLKNEINYNDEILSSIQKIKNQKIINFYTSFFSNKQHSEEEYFDFYTEIQKLLHVHRLDVADQYKLLFETDKDSYYLITMITIDIPKIIESLAILREIGTRIISSNNNDKKLHFLLENSISLYLTQIYDLKDTASRLSTKKSEKINDLIFTLDENYEHINNLINNINNQNLDFSSKEYFFKVSELISSVNNLFNLSKNLLIDDLEERKSLLQIKLLTVIILYILLSIIVIYLTYQYYRKLKQEEIDKHKIDNEVSFINKIRDDYEKSDNLKDICNKSLLNIVDHFGAVNASLYLLNLDNSKLYLGSTYGIDHKNIKQTLSVHDNLIAENILEKKINFKKIDVFISLGNVNIRCTRLVTAPLLEFDKSIGTLQLTFDEKSERVDTDFLNQITSFIASYISKAQKDEESKKYLNLIDKNILMSKTDLNGNIIEVSTQLCMLSQYEKNELIGQKHRILRHPDMPKDVFKDLWKTIKQEHIWRGELKNRKKDGGFYWISSVITPDHDINGNVTGYTAMRHDITDKKKIEDIAITDGLTSLYNRRHFDNVFPAQIETARRSKTILVFALIDIDNFKKYNDTYGHQDGDTTLKQVALSLKNTLNRVTDSVYRLGGEEFGMLYTVENKEDALTIANQARVNIENLKILHSKNIVSKYVTISTGIYILEHEDSTITADEIYKKCDEALYIAKDSGRNKVVSSSG